MDIRISTPRNFNFKRTVISHGWRELLPFEFDLQTWTLKRALDLNRQGAVTVEIKAARGLRVRVSKRISQKATHQVVKDVRHMLRLDDDMSSFYEQMSATPDFEWITRQGAGRLLRSPTVFEDLVKMICTTNCSWALTEKMVTGLVVNLGRESNDKRRTFPTPEAMAVMPERFYVDEVRAGYRASYLKELAERVASRQLDVESWNNSELPANELARQIQTVKGAGPYAAENLLKLLGHYNGLALDSWTRAKFYQVRNNGRKASDKKIARYYSRFREWRGLALWCDMTRDWLENEQPTAKDNW